MYPPETIARVCHEANRAFQLETGDPQPSPSWDEAPGWQRLSALEGVEKALDGASPEELHEAWCEFKRAHGWQHGEVKDETAKTHPCLVPYEQLPEDQRIKDDLFEAIVTALSPTEHAQFELAGRDPSVVAMAKHFSYDHLPPHLRSVSRMCSILAIAMVNNLPDDPELSAGLRHLLQAKDCFVRAARSTAED